MLEAPPPYRALDAPSTHGGSTGTRRNGALRIPADVSPIRGQQSQHLPKMLHYFTWHASSYGLLGSPLSSHWLLANKPTSAYHPPARPAVLVWLGRLRRLGRIAMCHVRLPRETHS